MVTQPTPFLDQLAEQVGGPGTRVRDPQRFTEFLALGAQEFAPVDPNDDPISKLSREVQLLEQGHISPEQASPEARALAAQRFDPGPSLNPLQMASDYARALPQAGRVLGEATLTAAYPISLAGSGAATIGAEKAGLGPNWQTAAGIVGGLAEAPRAVVGAREVPTQVRPLSRAAFRGTQKLGTAEAVPSRGILGTIGENINSYRSPAPLPEGTVPQRGAPVTTRGGMNAGQINIDRLESGKAIARGKRAALDRIDLEVRMGRLSPDVADSGRDFIKAVPDKYFDRMGTSFIKTGSEAVTDIAQGTHTAGVYLPEERLLTIIKNVANTSDNADRIIIHEVAHHLSSHVSPDDVKVLVRQFQKEAAGKVAGTTQENYRFTNFAEWFAETITDKTLRDYYKEASVQGALGRAWESIKDIATATVKWLMNRGRADEAEKVYRRFLAGDQPVLNRGMTGPMRLEVPSVGVADALEPQNPLQRLTQFIKVQKPGNLRAATEAARKVELGQKSARVQAALSGSGTPGERFIQGRIAQQGDLPASVFQPAGQRASVSKTGNLVETVRPDVITTPEINTLYDQVQKAGLQSFATQNATDALTKALVGELPTRSEIILLRRTLGDDFADALMTHRPNAERYRDMIIETLNLPRSLFQTVGDFSGLLRQGGVFAASRPVRFIKSSPAFLKAAFSKRYFNEIQESIRTHPRYQQSQDAGLFIASTGSDITAREEAVISRWIQKIPVIGWVPAASERSYVGGLNKLRWDTYNDILNGWEKAGVPLTNEMKMDAAKVINFATGRGTLGVAEEAAPYLSAAFYSPRFLASRVQLPLKEAGLIYKAGRYAIKGDPKLALAYANLARNTISFVASGMGILLLLKLREGQDLKVETDARSSDFGKITYKNTRYDFWAGYQQIARYTWQLMAAETKSLPESSSPNKINKYANERQILIPARFVRSKLAPATGLATDLKLGKTLAGDEIGADKETAGRVAYSNLTPFFIQSLVDAAKAYDDPKAALYGLPSASGVGVTTITPRQGSSGSGTSEFDYRKLIPGSR